MTKTLPKQALAMIEAYKNLNLGDKKVQCPYRMNTDGTRVGLKVFLGKGLPTEIEEEAVLIAKRDKIDLSHLSVEGIREFLRENGLGVDCSGLIANILNVSDKQRVKKLATRVAGNIIRRFLAGLRPVENLSVEGLTHPENSLKCKQWHDVLPGDMIRTRNGKHALLIKEIEYTDSEKLRAITYVHSTNAYGITSGVREGRIEITNLEHSLEDQKWLEIDETSKRNITHEGLLDGETNGVYRLR